jgi:hypothetical protein
VVRPGSLHGWSPFDPPAYNGRWVTGPGTPPLGRGREQLKTSSTPFDSLEREYSTPTPDLPTFVATYDSYGSTPAEFGIVTDANVGLEKLQTLYMVPTGSPGWHSYDAMDASTWVWDCDGDRSLEGGPGSIADFEADCNSSAKVAAEGLFDDGLDTYVEDVVIGPSGSTTTYDLEPPLASIHDNAKKEGDGRNTISFRVKLSGRNDDPVKMNFATANGTAVAGKDYVARQGTLKIPAGARSAVIKIVVLGDTKKEPDETVKVKLSAPKNASFGDRVAVGTIINDD